MNTTFTARDIKVSFGGHEVVHGANLTATPGRITALLGPNGAGKSTTLRACFGKGLNQHRNRAGVVLGAINSENSPVVSNGKSRGQFIWAFRAGVVS